MIARLRRTRHPAIAIAVAILIIALGLSGAYAYGSNYDTYRGANRIALLKGAGTGRLLVEHFDSPALRKPAYYLVYLPPGYTSTRHYPVYYLLHGEPGDPRGFVNVAGMDTRLDNLMLEHRSRPMILVYPNGQIDNRHDSDSEWANTPTGDFESYVIEVMHDVDARFSTIRDRDGRVLAGFSMGAYGAMNIGLHHLGDFASIQAWSGYYIETHNGVFAHASPRTMADNSPGEYVTHLRGAIHRDPLDVFMYVGNRDPDAAQQPPMARALREAGAHVGDRVYPGGHDWAMWWPRLDPMIELASADTLDPPLPTRLNRRPVKPVPAHFGDIVHHARRSRRCRGDLGSSSALRGHRVVHRTVVVSRPPGGPPTRHVVEVLAPLPRSPHPTLRLVGALLLALIASALINLGFVLQHRGHAEARRGGGDRMRDVLTSPMWLLGQLVGWLGWAGQIVAVALVPLTLVQAVGAGSLALSVPLAAWLFDYRVSRRQTIAIAAIALALTSLPVGAGQHGHLGDGLLIGIALLLGLGCALGCVSRSTTARAVAAGVLYGVADAAVKADSIALHHHGLAGLLSGWTVVAALATFGGFLAFQAALRGHDAVQPLSLMAAFSAVTGVIIGTTAFREPLGSSVPAGILHVAAIVVVLLCVPALARAQQQLAGEEAAPERPAGGRTAAGDSAAGAPVAGLSAAPGVREWARAAAPRPPRGANGWERDLRPWRTAVRAVAGTARSLAILLATVVAGVAGVGLLYSMRGLHILGFGPRISDSLPLLTLAGHGAQPLARVLVASVLSGVALGIVLSRTSPVPRMLVVAPTAVLLLLVASDASFALSTNVGFWPVLAHREPGLGPWLQWLLLAGFAALPGLRSGARRSVAPDTRPPVTAVPA